MLYRALLGRAKWDDPVVRDTDLTPDSGRTIEFESECYTHRKQKPPRCSGTHLGEFLGNPAMGQWMVAEEVFFVETAASVRPIKT